MSEVKEINQLASKGVREQIDGLVLQSILKMIEESKLKDEEMITFKLGKCPFCPKQHILVEKEENTENEEDTGVCVICSNPVDNIVVVYQFKKDGEDTQIICLDSEAEELVKKLEAGQEQE